MALEVTGEVATALVPGARPGGTRATARCAGRLRASELLLDPGVAGVGVEVLRTGLVDALVDLEGPEHEGRATATTRLSSTATRAM